MLGIIRKKPDNRVAVPEDLESVTTREQAREASPQELGLSRKGVNAIWSAVEEMYRSGLHPGISLVLRRHGQVVLSRAIGHARGNAPGEQGVRKVLMRPDTPACLFSSSKAVTAMLVHGLAEQGLLSLDDRVAEYLPEYAAEGKQDTTLRQLLAHRAGIPGVPVKDPDPRILYDWDGAIRMLCAAAPLSRTGQQQAYHAITGGYILGEVAQRVSGKPLRELLAQMVCRPLGLRHFNYGMPEADQALAAQNAFTGPRLMGPFAYAAKRALGIEFERVPAISNEADFMSAVIPAGNIFASADESCRFFEMLRRGGELDGRRVFAPETVREAVRPVARIHFDRTLLVPIRYSAGMMLGEWPFGLYGEKCRQAFGHLGYINIVCWADPQRALSGALITTGKPLSVESAVVLGRVMWAISHHCAPV